MVVVYLRLAVIILASLLGGCEAVVVGISNLLSPPQQLHLVRSLTTRVGNQPFWDRAQHTFFRTDTVYFHTVATWGRRNRSAGLHQIVWKWYTNGHLISDHWQQLMFPHAPYQVFGSMPGNELGGGHHHVEVYIDDQLFDSADFDVVSRASTS